MVRRRRRKCLRSRRERHQTLMHDRRRLREAVPAGHNESLMCELPRVRAGCGSSRAPGGGGAIQARGGVFVRDSPGQGSSFSTCFRLGFANGQAVSSVGQSGGLALFWRGDIIMSLQSMSKSHIDMVLSCASLNVQQWRFTGFYGEP
jgi:hypothetical protein